VLKIFGLALDHSSEEPVGSMRSRERPEKSIRTNETFRRDIFSQDKLERRPGAYNAEFVERATERFVDDEFIFFRLQRTCGIYEPPTRREGCESVSEQAELERVQIGKIFGAKSPADLRVPREGASTRARRVHQNAVERASEWQRLCSIERDAGGVLNTCSLETFRHLPHPMAVQVRCDHVPLRPCSQCQQQRLAPRSRAKIKNVIPGSNRQ